MDEVVIYCVALKTEEEIRISVCAFENDHPESHGRSEKRKELHTTLAEPHLHPPWKANHRVATATCRGELVPLESLVRIRQRPSWYLRNRFTQANSLCG